MKTARILLTALALGAATTPALAAGDWKFLPIADKGYAPAFVASVTGGIMDPQHVGSGDAWGLELAFNCGLVQTPTGVVRTKLSVNKFDKAGLELTTVELNPRWTIPVAKDLTFGIGQLNLGLGARWQDTVNKNLGGGREGADNWLVQAKVGIAF